MVKSRYISHILFPLERCYKDFMTSQLGCSLPWSPVEAKEHKSRVCSTMGDFELFRNISNTLFSLDVPRLQQLTGCLPPCTYFQYNIKDFTERFYTFNTRKSIASSMETIVAWVVFVRESSYLVEKEVLMHDMGNLIADIGGYLGLLLGVSILDVFDILLYIGNWWAQSHAK